MTGFGIDLIVVGGNGQWPQAQVKHRRIVNRTTKYRKSTMQAAIRWPQKKAKRSECVALECFGPSSVRGATRSPPSKKVIGRMQFQPVPHLLIASPRPFSRPPVAPQSMIPPCDRNLCVVLLGSTCTFGSILSNTPLRISPRPPIGSLLVKWICPCARRVGECVRNWDTFDSSPVVRPPHRAVRASRTQGHRHQLLRGKELQVRQGAHPDPQAGWPAGKWVDGCGARRARVFARSNAVFGRR